MKSRTILANPRKNQVEHRKPMIFLRNQIQNQTEGQKLASKSDPNGGNSRLVVVLLYKVSYELPVKRNEPGIYVQCIVHLTTNSFLGW